MRKGKRVSAAAILSACVVTVAPSMAAPCAPPGELREARPLAIRAYVHSTGKQVLTLAGYSGAEYEDPAAMRATVVKALAGRDPGTWIVNIGATAAGIGAAYPVAKALGFTTMGIVSVLARDEGATLSDCVDIVFYVPDTSWGGLTAAGHLSPTSVAIVETGTEFLAIGGGEVTRDEMAAARRVGKPVIFVAADMNHEIARKRALRKGLPEPVDFRGAAHSAL
ncbi:MAG: hypothetical protein KF710_09295 [Rhodocyclaceae bacterium]|nr:hypothetical protein [Rhodocyclaceae bacterium]